MATSRKLIVCCDGTWNDAADHTHILRIHQAIADQDESGVEQLHAYFSGVGTAPGSRLIGGIFGYGLSERVREAYRWLVENHRAGDQIFCFGFSRGAYTVRSLCGFLNYAGLLAVPQLDLLDSAYAAYRLPVDQRATCPFHQDLPALATRRVQICFLGVFDTVGALGVPFPWLKRLFNRNVEFHDTRLSAIIDCACQALAIDERRGPYRPALWTGKLHQLARPDGSTVEQQVYQVWFPGVHSDIGGGYPDKRLGDLALEWMLARARARACGLHLRPDLAIAPDGAGKLHDSYSRWWQAMHRLPSIDSYDRPIGLEQRKRREAIVEDDLAVLGEFIHLSALDRHHGAAAERLTGAQRPYRPAALPVEDVAPWCEPAPLSDAA